MARAAGPNGQMSNSVGRVYRAQSVQRRKALVDVVVPYQHEIGTGRIQVIHEWLHVCIVRRA